MTIRSTLLGSTAESPVKSSTSFMPAFSDMGFGMRRSFMPVFAPEGAGGEGGEGGGEGGTEGGEGGEGGKTNTKTTDDKEARKLARDLAAKQKALETASGRVSELETQLKRFDGIDPEKVRELLEEKAQAENEKKKAEEERLKAAGDFEALKTRMASEHQKEIAKAQEQVREAQNQVAAFKKQIHELTIGAAFAASAYLRDETLLPPAKARRAYEDYFEVTEGGQVQGYSAPAGDKNRVPLVDSRGRPLPFDEAMKQIIDEDSDRDHILKAKNKQGSGQVPGARSGTNNSQSQNEGGKEQTGIARIAAALAKRK